VRILGRSPQGFLIPLLLLAAGVTGCATSRHLTAGETAERLGRFDDAVVHYARAVAEDPSDSAAALSLTRAKLRAAEGHAREAERLAAQQDYPGAEDALRAAIILAPSETSYQERLAIIQEAVEGQAEETRVLTLAELKKEALTRPLGLDMPEDARAPASFVFRDASLRYVLLTIGEIAGVNVAFDEDFVDQSVSIEAEDSSFEDVIRSLTETTGHFFRVESPHLITIVPDTQNKRLQYERQVAQTFYLSSADLVETADTLRIVLGIRQIAQHAGTNSITMVDTWEQVRSAQRIIKALDRSPGEVVVDVELMEVNRTHLEQYGIPLLSAGAEGISAALTPRLDTVLQNPYERGNLQITGLPGAILNLVRSDSDTHVLANPQLRASDGKTATADFGERVPVPVTTFAPFAAGGLAQQPTTTFEYENVGVSIEVRPRIHHDDSVTLEIKVRLDNVSGTGYSGLPTFGNRNVETTLRLRNGETSMIAGLIRQEERSSLSGLPGIADIPVIGRLFGQNSNNSSESDIILTITPRIARRADLDRETLLPHIVRR
jgi:general secretion pathway protein D